MSRIVQYLGISSLICLAVTTSTFFEMIGYCVLQNLWLESFHFQGHIYVGFRLHNMYTILHNHGYEKLLTDLITQFQIGTLEFLH